MSWFETMQAIQTVVETALAAAIAAETIDDGPVVVIMPGDSAWDQCERVTIFLGNVEFTQRACSVKPLAEYRVRMNVCIPGDPKTKAATWETEAKNLYDLAEIVLGAVTSNLAALFGDCETATVLPLLSLQPSGGQAGVEFGVRTS